MSTETKIHTPRERPSNPLLRRASENRFLRNFFEGTFRDEIDQYYANIEGFSDRFLTGLGAFDHPTLSDSSIKLQFSDQFAANLFEGVYHYGPMPTEGLDGKNHKIDEDIWMYCFNKFTPLRNTQAVYGDIAGYERRELEQIAHKRKLIDMEARYTLLTVVVPTFKAQGTLGIFVEDFISTIHGRPQNRSLPHIGQELVDNVALRLDHLGKELNRV